MRPKMPSAAVIRECVSWLANKKRVSKEMAIQRKMLVKKISWVNA
jgi:hypothetical protein